MDAKRNNDPTITVWGSGKARREFLYVDDLVDCMIWSMHNLDKTDTFLNCGTGIDISIKELTEKVCDIVGYKGNLIFDLSKPDGMLRKCTDVSKINALGWKAKTSLDKGLLNTIKYYEGL